MRLATQSWPRRSRPRNLRRDVLQRDREPGDIAVCCGGCGPECDGSNRGSDGGCDPEGYHPTPPWLPWWEPTMTLMERPSKGHISATRPSAPCGVSLQPTSV